jgi:asparagine synthase (glutamine-hydrolysing)
LSGIAGVIHLDGSPIDAHVLARMTDAVAHRGPDGSGTWVNGWVGLGHRILRTTPESLDEHQPLCDESGRVCLVLDGRVDNREELGTALEAKGVSLRDRTDAELVLKSYLHWGDNSPVRILGDFAFAIWDGRINGLFCARDVFGIRPFNYFCSHNYVLIASELHQLFCDSRTEKVANEGMAAEYLSGQITHCEETLWKDIFRLPAAHSIWVTSRGIQKRRYWDFDLSKEVRYGSDEEYACHFLSLFRQAVRCRLRSRGQTASYLSGGLDSSSVSVIANELRRELVSTEPTETFSLAFSGASCDESKYIQEIVRQAGLRSHLFQADSPGMDFYHQQARRYQDFPGWPNGQAMSMSLQEGLRQAGIRIMLTGWGGNECMEGAGGRRITELAREGRLVELARATRAEAAITNSSWWAVLMEHGVRANIPLSLKRAVRAIRQKPFEWIPTEFVKQTGLLDRIQPPTEPRGGSPVQQAIRSNFYSGWSAHFHESWDRDAALFSREERHPFFDRRLVEFSFALPETQRSHRGLVKVLVRKAMRSHLPQSVIERKVQTDFTPVFMRAFCGLDGQNIFSSSTIAAMGWIVPERLSSSLQNARSGNSDDLWLLWAAVGIESWYRNTRERSPEFPVG